jgi:hypothetical protein
LTGMSEWEEEPEMGVFSLKIQTLMFLVFSTKNRWRGIISHSYFHNNLHNLLRCLRCNNAAQHMYDRDSEPILSQSL